MPLIKRKKIPLACNSLLTANKDYFRQTKNKKPTCNFIHNFHIKPQIKQIWEEQFITISSQVYKKFIHNFIAILRFSNQSVLIAVSHENCEQRSTSKYVATICKKYIHNFIQDLAIHKKEEREEVTDAVTDPRLSPSPRHVRTPAPKSASSMDLREEGWRRWSLRPHHPPPPPLPPSLLRLGEAHLKGRI